MEKNKVIKRTNVETGLPIHTTAIAYLLLDKFDATGWVWGAVGVVIAVVWISSAIALYNNEPTDLFEEIAKKSK